MTDKARAPKGGIRIAGKYYKGGRMLPSKYRQQLTPSRRPNDPAIFAPASPPNFGRSIVPHVISFSGMQTTLSRSYRHADEAMRDSIPNAHMMMNDPQVTEPLFARMRQTALFRWHIEPGDQKDPEQIALAQKVKEAIERTPYFTMYRWASLLAIWYGRYGIEHQYAMRRDTEGKKYYYVKSWTPISGDKLVFRYDDGRYHHDPDQVGIRVSPALAPRDVIAGERRLEPTADGLAYFLEPWERRAWLIHKHWRMDGEYEDPLSGGKIHGVGLRSFVYWVWLLKQEALSQLTEIVERTSRGFTIYWYPSGNDTARDEVAKIAQEQAHQNVILMPKDPEMEQYGIDVIPPDVSGLQALQDLITNHYGHLIKRLILGQTLSSEADATGLGSGVADAHMDTLYQIAKFDSVNQEETLTRELVSPIRDYNYPRYRDVDLYFKIDTDTAQPERELESAYKLWQMGARLKESEMMDKVGLSVPDADDQTLQNPQILQQMRLAEQAMHQGQFHPGGEGGMTDWLGGGIGPTVEEPQMMSQEGGVPSSTTTRGGDAGGASKTFGPIMQSKFAGAKPGTWPSKYGNNWSGPFTGERGGTFWRDSLTGEERYQDEKPSDSGAGEAAGGGKPEAAEEAAPPTPENAPQTAYQFGYQGGDPHSFVTKTARQMGYDPAGETKEERAQNAAQFLDQTHGSLTAIGDAAASIGYKPKSHITSTNAIHAARHIIGKAEETGYQRQGDPVADLKGAADHLINKHGPGKEAPTWLKHAETLGPAMLGIAATMMKQPHLAMLMPLASQFLKEYGKQFSTADANEKNKAVSDAIRHMAKSIDFQPKLGPVAKPKEEPTGLALPSDPAYRPGTPQKGPAAGDFVPPGQEPEKKQPKPKATPKPAKPDYDAQVKTVENTAADQERIAPEAPPKQPRHDPQEGFANLAKQQAGQDPASSSKQTLRDFLHEGVTKGWDANRFKTFAPKTTEAIEKHYGESIDDAIEFYEPPKQRRTEKVRDEEFNQELDAWGETYGLNESDKQHLGKLARQAADMHNQRISSVNEFRRAMAGEFWNGHVTAMQNSLRAQEDADIAKFDEAVQLTESSYPHIWEFTPHGYQNSPNEDKLKEILGGRLEETIEPHSEQAFEAAVGMMGLMEAANLGDIPYHQDATPEEKYDDEGFDDDAPKPEDFDHPDDFADAKGAHDDAKWKAESQRLNDEWIEALKAKGEIPHWAGREPGQGETAVVSPSQPGDDEWAGDGSEEDFDDDFNFGANAIDEEDEQVPFAKGAAIQRKQYKKFIEEGDEVSAELAREAFNYASHQVAKYASKRVGRRRTRGIQDAPGQALMDFADTAHTTRDPYDSNKHPKDARGKFAPTKPAKTSTDQQLGIWTQYIGPNGGHGWQNLATGEIVYQEEMPGSRGKAEDEPQTFLSAGEAAMAGKSHAEWTGAISDAYVSEQIGDDHPAWQSIQHENTGFTIDEYNDARLLAGKAVRVALPHQKQAIYGTVTGINDDMSIQVTTKDGKEYQTHASYADDLESYIAHQERKGRDTSEAKQHLPLESQPAYEIARKAVEEGANIHSQMRDLGMSIGERRTMMPEIEQHMDMLRENQPKSAEQALEDGDDRPEGVSEARWNAMKKHKGSAETFAKALKEEKHDDPAPQDSGSGLRHELAPVINNTPACGSQGCDPPEASTGRAIELDSLDTYDKFLVQFSGGKDSMACVLDLLDRGVPKEKIELWHQKIDGGGRHFMDWPITEDYCRKVAEHLEIPLFFQWREGGFEGELTKKDAKSGGFYYETGDGQVEYVPMGKQATVQTRERWPAQGCDLRTRWCSAYLKIDVAERAINNDPRYATRQGGKGKKFMFVSGERAEEGGRRDQYPEAELHGTNNNTRTMHHWRNVHKWSEKDVWDKMKEHGILPHPAYRAGYGRLSCQWCIFADKNQVASNMEIDPEGGQRIASYEDEFDHYINTGSWQIGNKHFFDTKKRANEFRDAEMKAGNPDPGQPERIKTDDGKNTSRGYSIVKKGAAGTSFLRDKPAWLKQQLMALDYSLDVTIDPADWRYPAGSFKKAGGSDVKIDDLDLLAASRPNLDYEVFEGETDQPQKNAKGFPSIRQALEDWYGNIPGGEEVIEKYAHLD